MNNLQPEIKNFFQQQNRERLEARFAAAAAAREDKGEGSPESTDESSLSKVRGRVGNLATRLTGGEISD